ncbi:MAG: M48 family metallopeptidase [Phycisphaerae bacterium]|nr:M48 family metallopeptidase [Phycisphaerae bacterium]
MWWWSVQEIWSWFIPALILFTGLSGRLGRFTERIGKKQVIVTILFVAIYFLIDFLLTLPVNYFAGYARAHAYGLSNQTLGRWLKGAAVNSGTMMVLYIIGFAVLRILIQRSPRRWWAYSSAVVAAIIFFYLMIHPVWVAPLLNRYGPLQDKTLEADILALADRAGIEGGRVFEVDMSRDTKALNASVRGIGKTKRIVFWDTLTSRLDHDEVLVVMAHEMGHYVLHHMYRTWISISLVYGLGLFLTDRMGRRIIQKYQSRLGFQNLHDVGAVPLFMLISGILFFAMAPLLNADSRYRERQADQFALELTHNNHAMAQSFVALQSTNLAVPYAHWFDKLLRRTHPSLGERIDFANTYRPWEEGKPGRYDKLFAPVNNR